MYVKYEIQLRDCKMSLVLFIMYVIFVSSYFFNLKKRILHHIILNFQTSNRNPRKKNKSPTGLGIPKIMNFTILVKGLMDSKTMHSIFFQHV